MDNRKRIFWSAAMSWVLMMSGVVGVWLVAKLNGVQMFSDSRIVWVIVSYIVLVQLAVLAIVILGLRANKVIEAQTREVMALFSSFTPSEFTFYNRPYLAMRIDDFYVFATWFYQTKKIVSKEPFGLLYVKIPKTNGIRLHATTRVRASQGVATMFGWRYLDNGICLGPMLRVPMADSEKIAERLAPTTIALLNDEANFPYGVGIVSNWHERMVGKKASLALVGGDEAASKDLDLQVRFSLDIGKERVELLVKKAIEAALAVAKDFSS